MVFAYIFSTLICFVNLIFLIVGGLLIYASFSIQLVSNELEDLPDTVQIISLANQVMLGLGIIIVIISFFGCWGAFAGNKGFLLCYTICLVILIVIEACAGFLIFYGKNTVKENGEKHLRTALRDYEKDENKKQIIDNIQANEKCCGIEGPGDWKGITSTLPATCCEGIPEICNPAKAYSKGCLSEVLDKLNLAGLYVIYTIGGIIAFELIVLILTLYVRNSINRKQGVNV